MAVELLLLLGNAFKTPARADRAGKQAGHLSSRSTPVDQATLSMRYYRGPLSAHKGPNRAQQGLFVPTGRGDALATNGDGSGDTRPAPPRQAAKHQSKSPGFAESASLGDAAQLEFVGIGQQFLGPLNARPIDVLIRRAVQAPLEVVVEITRARPPGAFPAL